MNDIDINDILEGIKNAIMGACVTGYIYFTLNEVPLFSFAILCFIVYLILIIIISYRSAKSGDDQ